MSTEFLDGFNGQFVYCAWGAEKNQHVDTQFLPHMYTEYLLYAL